MRVKFIEGVSLENLEAEMNAFLAGLKNDPKSVRYEFDRVLAIIEYDDVEKGRLCIDCKYWDDNGDNLIGLCQMCGGRKRFSDKSCNKFKDVRE